eukprot:TRINITY_DN22938_c0_g1_i1.p1 TRINITY_DN22938_c0_g1~~TRINITY_DN22938_c0_g1_i1.p1  ORF type:complete len:955 (-),score=152.54 TRINITY_DN22938_c0_g1_i1:40-2868(-)
MPTQLDDELVKGMEKAVATGHEDDLRAIYSQLPPAALDEVVSVLKGKAREAFDKGDMQESIKQYSLALLARPEDHTLYGNRSLCFFRLKDYVSSMQDADACIQLKPKWPKGWYRKGCVFLADNKPDPAVVCLKRALEFEPSNTDTKLKLQQAEQQAAMMKSILEGKSETIMTESLVDDTEKLLSSRPQFEQDQCEVQHHPQARWFQESQQAQGVVTLFRSFAQLYAPQRLLELLRDRPDYIHALCRSTAEWIQHRVSAAERAPRVLLFGSVAGVLAMAASEAGADHVYAVETSPFIGGCAKTVVRANKFRLMQQKYADKIQGMTREQLKDELAQYAKDTQVIFRDSFNEVDYTDVYHKCDLAVVNCNLHYSLLGTGLIPAVLRAREKHLEEGGEIIPQAAQVYAVGIQLDFDTEFDVRREVTEVTAWSLHPRPVQLNEIPHTVLTEKFPVFDFKFGPGNSLKRVDREPRNVRVLRAGTLHAFVYHYDLVLSPSHIVTTAPDNRSATQCIFYHDPVPVEPENNLRVLVSHNQTRITFRVDPPPPPLVHRVSVHTWHCELINDRPRTEAYSRAVALYAEKRAAAGLPVNALVLCSSFGTVAMKIARLQDVTHVWAVEKNPSMAARCQRIVSRNGLAGKITVLNKDPRQVSAGEDREVPLKPDLVVIEAFDHACIGSGALHYSQFVRNVVGRDVSVVPRRAVIRGMLVELRSSVLEGMDVNVLNPYRWQPDMIACELSKEQCKPLSRPFELFFFDLRTASPEPALRNIEARIQQDGIAGAVVIWQDLLMDEESEVVLTSSPAAPEHCLRSKCLLQGLQYLREVRVTKGSTIPMLARHNGQGIEIAIKENLLPEGQATILPLPRLDPQWAEQNKKLTELYKSMTGRMQIVGEYQHVSTVAVRCALQPGNFEVDPEVATQFAESLFVEAPGEAEAQPILDTSKAQEF